MRRPSLAAACCALALLCTACSETPAWQCDADDECPAKIAAEHYADGGGTDRRQTRGLTQNCPARGPNAGHIAARPAV